jgi:hypothetical protein
MDKNITHKFTEIRPENPEFYPLFSANFSRLEIKGNALFSGISAKNRASCKTI